MDKEKMEALFEMLVKLMSSRGTEAQQKINDWIREGSGKPMLPLFKQAEDIPEDGKFRVYQLFVKALAVKDWEPALESALAQSYESVTADKSEPKEAEAEVPDPKPAPKKAKKAKPETEAGEPPASDTDAAVKLLRKMLGGQDASTMTTIASTAARTEVERWVEKDLQGEMEKRMKDGAFPEERVTEMIDARMEGLVLRVAVQLPDGSSKEMNRQHYKFPLLLAAVNAGMNVALVGPAGSGKSEACRLVAEALDLAFEATSVGPQTSKADLFGFRDANGNYHSTHFTRRLKEGGVLLLDEMDAANAGVLTYTNMALSNGMVGTPDGMLTKHEKFRLVAGLNTYGMGANRVYVGRSQLDGATMDRFAVIDWDYDEGLESHIIGVEGRSPKLKMDDGGTMEPENWIDYVQKARRAVQELKIRHVVSPRATIFGHRLFAAGIGRKHVEDMVLWKGMEETARTKVKQKMGE